MPDTRRLAYSFEVQISVRFFISIVVGTIGFYANALELPKGLTAADRLEVVQTVGLGSSEKMLTNPYPLGGYSGFEIGYSMEFINVRDINHLGCAVGSSGCPNTEVPDDNEFRFSRFTIGKGLYHDIDLFFSFAPPVGGSNISDYGASIRWAFYQAAFLPLTFSAVVSGNRMNVGDEYITKNFGGDLMLGVTVDSFSLFFGGGETWSSGTFMVYQDPANPGNGTVSSTDPDAGSSGSVTTRTQNAHVFVGFSLQYENLFAAAEIDHYHDSVYSAKVGLRF